MASEFKNYVIDYTFADSTWSLNLPAKDKADVLERLAAISRTAIVFGYEKDAALSSDKLPAFPT